MMYYLFFCVCLTFYQRSGVKNLIAKTPIELHLLYGYAVLFASLFSEKRAPDIFVKGLANKARTRYNTRFANIF